jgi:Mrp family chromosome partitioning ATPase
VADPAEMFSSIASMIGVTKPSAINSATSTPIAKAVSQPTEQAAAPPPSPVPALVPTLVPTLAQPMKAAVTSSVEDKPVGHEMASPLPALSGAAVAHTAIVESLVSRFAAESSCLIHFCDTDQPRRAAEVCFSIGMEYAEKIQRRVLLLDTSRSSRPLSSLLGVDLAAGFREVLRTELNWRHLVRQTSHPLVDVLPAGVVKLNTTATRADFEFQIRKLFVELSAHYGGVFSCADTAFDLESELIGLCSNGGFLTMDFHRTSRGLAKSAANQLRTSGTRLLGCIAAAASKQAG